MEHKKVTEQYRIDDDIYAIINNLRLDLGREPTLTEVMREMYA